MEPSRVLGTTAGLLLVFVTLAQARPKGPDVHHQNTDCLVCHTADAATLNRDPASARDLIVPDADARCFACHAGEGPSHKTGVRPRGNVPANLPLSREGFITCATCHFVHGEGDRSRDFERVDNRRGQLCLTCHKLSDLQ